MSTREIVGHLRELYGIDVSPDLISTVTDAVLEEVAAWQGRPLDAVYPLVFFDALRVKIRDEGLARNKAMHIALGVRADGAKEILGLWIEQNEGAKFWLRVMNGMKNRGVEDILLAVVDGLKGFPEAITAVFPEATVQRASFFCCATASTSFPIRIESQSRRRSRPSIGPLTPERRKKPWPHSKTASGVRNTRRSGRAGDGHGTRLFRSMRSRLTCVESCTRPTP